jgi:glyoxylase-like metal-dependent hydrolase (beta-lactamase superfamily II)
MDVSTIKASPMRILSIALPLATALLSLGMAAGSRADDISEVPVAPAAHPFRLGNLELAVLHDSELVVPNDGKTFGIDAKPGEVAAVLRAASAPTTKITLSVNVLMVRTDGHIALLDTGIGAADHGALLASLKLTGVSPQSVTDVLITHSHGDHIGGLLDAKGQLAFPKATVHMAGAEWDWLKTQGPANLVAAITAHVATFAPGATVIPGIRSRALAGHTPGHVAYEIASGHAQLLDIGDLAHSWIVSLAKPQWTMGFDTDRTVARATRVKALAALASSHELIYTPHFPYPGLGHIVAAADGFKWDPAL